MLTATRSRKAIKAVHVRQVHRAKSIIGDAAADLIERQFLSAAEELEQGGIAKGNVIFRPRDWDQRLRGALAPPIARVMLMGAAAELKARRGKASKSSASDYLSELGLDLDGLATEMPQELIDSIEATLADSFKREYWQLVNNKTRADLDLILRRGIPNGLSIRELAAEIRNQATGYSRSRATTIARTESTRALNSGHVEGIEEVERDAGIELGKSWLSVAGATSRQEHVDLDGVTVPTDEPFYLGGYPCMFPGDASLPPEHAINCLCTVISGGGVLEN